MESIRSIHFVLYADIAWTLAIDHGAQATKQRLLRQDAKGVPVMDRYLIRNCPRCRGLMGVIVQRPEGTSLKAVNGKCVRCRHRLAWVVIRGKRTQELASTLAASPRSNALTWLSSRR